MNHNPTHLYPNFSDPISLKAMQNYHHPPNLTLVRFRKSAPAVGRNPRYFWTFTKVASFLQLLLQVMTFCIGRGPQKTTLRKVPLKRCHEYMIISWIYIYIYVYTSTLGLLPGKRIEPNESYERKTVNTCGYHRSYHVIHTSHRKMVKVVPPQKKNAMNSHFHHLLFHVPRIPRHCTSVRTRSAVSFTDMDRLKDAHGLAPLTPFASIPGLNPVIFGHFWNFQLWVRKSHRSQVLLLLVLLTSLMTIPTGSNQKHP